MNMLNRLVESKFVKKLKSYAPEYLAFAIGVAVVALAAGTEALQKRTPSRSIVISSHAMAIASPSAEAEPQPPSF